MAFRDFWKGLGLQQRANAAINSLGDTAVGRVFAAGEKSSVAYARFADLGKQIRSVQEMRNTLQEQLQGLAKGSNNYANIEQKLKDTTSALSELQGQRLRYALDTVSGYMTEGSAGQRAARWGLAGAAYLGSAAAIQGGINQDRRGNPNIAGIPFV